MNSLVLKPWRWVVFLGVIPGTTPCSGLLRPSALATGAARRAVPREACEVRRTGPAAVFFGRRPTPDQPLFDFFPIFPSPIFSCLIQPPSPGFFCILPQKNTPPREHSR